MTQELDFNGMIRLNADGDKETQLSIGVYNGVPSIVAFKSGGMLFKTLMNKTLVRILDEDVSEALKSEPKQSTNVNFITYDRDGKKFETNGSLTIGRDDRGVIYFGLNANGTKAKFPLRDSIKWDRADPMDDRAKSEIMAKAILHTLRTEIVIACALTSFKRERPANGNQRGGGGQRAAGGGGGGELF